MPEPDQEPPSAPNSAVIDLWLIATDTVETSVLESLEKVLAVDEQAQLQHRRIPAARRSFVLSRGCLRHLLSRYTGQTPGKLRFTYGPRGKPELAFSPHSRASDRQALTFNLSHSGTWLLVGVSVAPTVRAIGVDLEQLRYLTQLSGLCRRCLTPTEAKTVLTLGHPQADHRFLRYWTGKEACLKALGLGIADSMQTLELTLDAAAPTSTLAATGVATDWPQHPGQLYQWQPTAGYWAAIAVQSPIHQPLTFQLRQTTPAALVENVLDY
ncbi:4'-phosphopantetheinyl transferase superfamily protein [Nodosilinea sp. LEGE 06152]|uniref:4'-phosphopantetheinyl transferase family protein n=1 Tax=Nodosilinea sp. LEGE 06152 TaxID=2777966 RepID=UPI001880AB22|nr:4'-phosphopantetheinyl transferase superfamily protein [Nodosilinea sp. LEGE 06152]MBE9159245.1 4'-phosphopantetheinyl transferase superfamily protein [Nodosilinea sp. LEGE 06152]